MGNDDKRYKALLNIYDKINILTNNAQDAIEHDYIDAILNALSRYQTHIYQNGPTTTHQTDDVDSARYIWRMKNSVQHIEETNV